MGWALKIKTAENSDEDSSLEELKTANPNSPWAYFWKGLISEFYGKYTEGLKTIIRP